METIKFNVFGTIIIAMQTEDEWKFYTPTSEGKRREIENLIAPSMTVEELKLYLADIYHEYASPANPDVLIIE